MVTRYPAGIDTSSTLKPIQDGQPITGRSIEQLREAIIAIEEELGVKPSGVYTTVRFRLDTIENILGQLRIISLDQDLGGTLTHPQVVGIRGRPISDVPPTPGEVLVWDGIAWVPGTQPADVNFAGDINGNPITQTVVGFQGRPLSTNAPSPNQAYIWDGSQWTPGNASVNFSGDLSGDSFSQSVVGINGTPVTDSSGAQSGWVLTLQSDPLAANTFASPQAVATDGTFVWVGNNRNKTIDKVNLSTRQSVQIDLTSFLPGGSSSWPRKIICNTTLSPYLFVVGMDANRVLVIDRHTDAVVGIGDVTLRARSCAIDNLGNVWVSNHSGANAQVMRFVISDLIANFPTPVAAASSVLIGQGTNPAEEITFDGTDIWAVGSFGDVDRIDPTGNGTNIGHDQSGVRWLADVVAANGGIWLLNQQLPGVEKIDPTTFPSGISDSVTLSNISYARTMKAFGGFLWVPDTDTGNGCDVYKVGMDPLTLVATIPPPADEQAYFEIIPDTGLSRVFIAVQQATDPNHLGFDVLDTVFDTFTNPYNLDTVTGLQQVTYAPGGGGGGGNTFTYRPGGVADATSNVFTSWSALMAARAAFTSEAIIVLDSTLSGTPNTVTIDPGIWDLTANTKLVGLSKNNSNVSVVMGDGVNTTAFTNPFEFENIRFNGPIAEQSNTIDVSGMGSSVHIIFRDCSFANNGFVFTLFTPNALFVFDCYGSCQFGGGMVWVANGATFVVNAYDSTAIEADFTFEQGNAEATFIGNVYSSGAYIRQQSSWANTQTIEGANLYSGFNAASIGALPFKSDVSQTDWVDLPGGSLGNTYLAPTVIQVDGLGGNVNITCPQQTSTAIAQYQPTSIQATFIATGAFEVILGAYNVAVGTGVQADVIVTAIDSSSTNFASWKMSFGALNTSGSAVTVGSVPAPSGIVPDRSTAGAAAWISTVVLTGNTISVKGQATAGIRWGISFQAMPVTP